MRLYAALLFLISFLFCGVYALQQDNLQSQVLSTIESSAAKNAYWALSVRDEDGNLVVDINSNKSMTPASNLKLLTSAAVLDSLGPDFRYITKIYGKGELVNGIWQGDLYIVGSGDPSISGLFYAGNQFHVFEELHNQLSDYGIKAVAGNLIGNEAYFDGETLPAGWNWDDLPYYYAAETGALSFNNNCVDLEVKSGGVGSKPSLSWFPFNTDYVTFINDQTVVPARDGYQEFYRRLPGMNVILLRSKLPANYTERESLTISNPTEYFLDTFQRYLADKNLKIQGKLEPEYEHRDFPESDYKLLASHQSVPLKELIKQVNKKSDNFYTEMLLKTAAAEKYKTQGSVRNGLSLVRDFALRMGFNDNHVYLSDGSGLSETNLISTGGMTQFLNKMRQHDYFKEFEESLSVAGVDGSLSGRFGGSPLVNKIKGKTGYITGTKALSGYLQTKSGRTVSFSIITNHFTNAKDTVGYTQNQILEKVYQAL